MKKQYEVPMKAMKTYRSVQGFSERTCSRISQRGSLCNPQQASSLFLHPIEVDSAERIRYCQVHIYGSKTLKQEDET